jgi:hypothetical protein
MKEVTRPQMIFCAWLILAQAAFVSTLALSAPLADQSSQPLAVPRGAKETLIIDGSALRLRAHIWRDFMPGAVETKTRGLIATIALGVVNGMSVRPTLHADTVWMVQRGRVWKTDEIEELEHHNSDPSTLSFAIRNGPEWPTKSFVDVFVRVADQHGAHYLFVLRHQIINMAV